MTNYSSYTKTLNWCFSIFSKAQIKSPPLSALHITPLLFFDVGYIKCSPIYIICVFWNLFHHLHFYHIHIPPFFRRQLWYNSLIHFSFKRIVCILCKPCTRNIYVDLTSNIAVNRNVIFLPPYSKNKNQSKQSEI